MLEQTTKVHRVQWRDIPCRGLRALLIAAYNRSGAELIGGRCNDKDMRSNDDQGRAINVKCRDTTPAPFMLS